MLDEPQLKVCYVMKVKYILLSLLLIVSCAVAEIEPEEAHSTKSARTNDKMYTKAHLSAKEEERIFLYQMQSNKELMMYDMLMQKDGVLFFPLSLEDAKSLGITEKQYSDFVIKVKDMNDQKE